MGNGSEKKLGGEAEKRARCWRRRWGELLTGKLARHLMIGLCRSLLEAADTFPGSGSCVRRSAEGREQWAGRPSSRTVTPRAGNMTEKHVQCTCAATHWLFYTITPPSYLLCPVCKPK